MKKSYINKIHISLELIGYILMLLSVAYATVVMLTTDGEIPTHYSITGEVDGYGSPATLLILPASMIFSCVIITICLHLVPASKWNTGFKINSGKENIVLEDYGYMMASMVLEMGAYSLAGTYLFDKGSAPIMIASIALVAISILTVVIFFSKAYRDNMD